jgi:6-phosphogluconolactonase
MRLPLGQVLLTETFVERNDMANHKFNWGGFLLKALMPAALALTGAGQAGPAHADEGARGMAYTATNAAAGNEIVAFERARDGSLAAAGRVATNGLGTGGGLGNQGALTMSRNGHWLFAVNAGSDEISVFSIRRGLPRLIDKIGSGGTRPVSVTVHDDVLYVLNAGGDNNISGFRIGEWGKLAPIANSTKPLSAPASGPAQIEFTPDGDTLVVTEKATNKISLYAVEDGVANGPAVRDSVGMTPFGFAFDGRGRLIVSEAFGGAPGQAALSSYNVSEEGNALSVISASVKDNQSAACWVVVTRNGRYAYTTNTASGSVSGYRVARDGSLSLLGEGLSAVIGAGSGPIDASLSRDSRFLYVLNGGIGTVSGFRVERDDSLSPINNVGGLPAGANGLVAR